MPRCYIHFKQEQETLTKSLMVSVGVSALGRTGIHFIELGVKINGDYYWNTLVLQCILPDNQELSDYLIVQQQGPAHCARRTVKLLESITADYSLPPILWPQTAMNPADYKIWRVMQENVYMTKVGDVEDLWERIMILREWGKLDRCIIDQVVGKWRQRFRACARLPAGNLNTNCDL